MSRLAKMVTAHGKAISGMTVTLDSHHRLHIAHPIFWVDSAGNHPSPFTLISSDDVRTGKWRSYNPGFQARAQAYVDALAANGRYVLIIWNPHCIIGTKGHNIHAELNDAIAAWELTEFDVAGMVTKGSNMFTEHYSAVRADVIDPMDHTTKLNSDLITLLQDSDIKDILITGEALSHCVANTIRDIAGEFSADEVKKFVLLEDACSNVGSFDKLGEDFVNEMVGKGMRVSTTTKFF